MKISLQKLYKSIVPIFFAVVLFAGKAYSQKQFKPVHSVNVACTPDSQVFNYTGGPVAFVVPSCVTSITVRAWGAGGGGAGNDSHLGLPGGGGAYASSTIAVTPGQVLTVVVGGGGALGVSHAASTGAGAGGYGLGNGGPGGDPGPSGTSGAGGGGGGGTGIVSAGTIIFDAGGGGGGGGGGNNSDGGAGGGGGQNGFNGVSGGFFNPASVGGNAGGSPDSIGTVGANQGGSDGGAGGGGGGGDNAGAGGGAPNCDCGGAGGGGGNSLGSTILNGNGQTPGNSTYSNLPAGAAVGGAQGVNGGNGYMVISWCQPPGPSASDVTTNPTCAGNDGTATINVSSGSPPFTYQWSSGQTTSSENNLGAGSYTVVVKDANGCKDSVMFTFTGSPPFRDSIVSFTNVSVACGSNGSALVGVKGGTGGYTYSWNTTPVQTNASATNLAAGSYTVTVNDAGGCTGTATVTITQPSALTASISASANVSCNGGNNGSATAGVTGGSAPYTYSWNSAPVQTTQTATGLKAGSYVVSVTDANNCTVTAPVTITQPVALRDSISHTVAVLCTGQANGAATDGVKGGTGTYTYSWNTAPVQTTQTATGLAMGNYTVTVTDASGCKDSAVATITQPAPLTLTAKAFPAACNGTCTGTATVIPAGGTGIYTYSWNTVPPQTGPTANNLCAGNYSVTVTDENGCVHDSTPLTVTQPPPIVLTKTTSAAFCNQADGSASVTISGGTPPYLYQWSNGATTTSITNVKPGPYCFGVEDANKCLDSICAIIPNTPGETASISASTNVTCNGGNNGSATAAVAGGTGPFTYTWNSVPAQNTQTATTLPAGSYTVTVTDGATGCTSNASVTITQPALVVATPLATPPSICIGQTSSLSATATGGTAPYSYAWAPGGGTGSPVNVTPIVTTTYTVVTADANNCPGAPVMVTVSVNPPLKVTSGGPAAICPGANATIFANATGGDGSYTYTWKPGNIVGSPASVSPATTTVYTVTVSDACGTPSDSATMKVIVDPLPVVAFAADTNNGCYPVCVMFTDNTTIASGTLKTWSWNFGNDSLSSKQNPATCYTLPGQYNVSLTVTSDSGCSSLATQNNFITVYDHPHPQFSDYPQPATIASPDVSFTDNSTDLYGVIQWFWSFGDPASANNFSTTQNNNSHTYSDTGTYTVTLIDVNLHGCVDSIKHVVVIEPLFTLYIPSAFTPNADGKNDVFIPKGTYFQSFDMYIFDRWGTAIFHTTDINKGWNGSVNNGSVRCQEDTYIYLITVTDFKGIDHSYWGRVSLVK